MATWALFGLNIERSPFLPSYRHCLSPIRQPHIDFVGILSGSKETWILRRGMDLALHCILRAGQCVTTLMISLAGQICDLIGCVVSILNSNRFYRALEHALVATK